MQEEAHPALPGFPGNRKASGGNDVVRILSTEGRKGEKMNAYTEESEYKGNPTIKIFTGHEYKGEKEYITLGVRKAAAVADCIDDIYKFVDAHRKDRK